MRRIITVLTLITFFMETMIAQKTEVQLIEQTVNYYLEGLANNDSETIIKAFHENATMKYIDNEYKELNARTFFREKIKAGPKVNRITRISSITIMGNAANVQVEMELPDYGYFDFLNMLKIDGKWQIVSKIYYKKI